MQGVLTLVRQVSNESARYSPSYAIANALVWAGYATMVVLVTWVLNFASPVAVTVSALVAAVLLYPLRRKAERVARQRFRHR
jgi:membrane protein implicated in regulation of membrane protease activity